MKFAFFVFLLGIAAGAFGLYYYQNQAADGATKTDATHNSAADKAEQPSISDRVKEDVKAAKDAVGKELEQAGQVVRTKAGEVGAAVSSTAANARVVATIKAKYTLDKELSARAIEVDCDKGIVTLRGTVASPALIAKAVSLALDTDGVVKVQSQLTVTAEKR